MYVLYRAGGCLFYCFHIYIKWRWTIVKCVIVLTRTNTNPHSSTRASYFYRTFQWKFKHSSFQSGESRIFLFRCCLFWRMVCRYSFSRNFHMSHFWSEFYFITKLVFSFFIEILFLLTHTFYEKKFEVETTFTHLCLRSSQTQLIYCIKLITGKSKNISILPVARRWLFSYKSRLIVERTATCSYCFLWFIRIFWQSSW